MPGPGWDKLIEETLEALGPTFKPVQIKEKFGGLRIYGYGGPENANEIIQIAEDKSIETCEICGNPGKPTSKPSGWIKTMCEAHAKDCAEGKLSYGCWASKARYSRKIPE